ncbi:hypothetical protein [Flavobacterium hydrophilum]|uniref:hypothetical protein n=1 Tax=Flavobacterium hydrophilum TaxID=2211445 RepID=UPI001E4DA073|nr:hypothetical protein [Flavobacterium hydrophilum]
MMSFIESVAFSTYSLIISFALPAYSDASSNMGSDASLTLLNVSSTKISAFSIYAVVVSSISAPMFSV